MFLQRTVSVVADPRFEAWVTDSLGRMVWGSSANKL
jgi:hypothetical protein